MRQRYIRGWIGKDAGGGIHGRRWYLSVCVRARARARACVCAFVTERGMERRVCLFFYPREEKTSSQS
jgi:DTW domain-containing protein YfiP